MFDLTRLRKGYTVYGANNQPLGTVDNVYDNYFTVNGQQYTADMIGDVRDNGIYLTGTGANTYNQTTDANTFRVPVAEEQLQVGKREVQAGAVRVHKEVVNEQQTIPVELRREEAEIQKIDTPDRPLRDGEAAFQEQTFEVPLRAEEAVVNKQAVVTGEVAINKNQQVEQRQVADTVRKERVMVDRVDNTTTNTSNYATTPTYDNTLNTQVDNTAYNTQTTTGAAQNGLADFATQLHEGYTVYGADEEKIGKIKQLDNDGMTVSRGFLQGDSYIPFDAVRNVTQDQVILNMTSDQVDNLS